MYVDHHNPRHDGFCRCRVCKPPLVGDHSAYMQFRAACAVAVVIAVLVALIR